MMGTMMGSRMHDFKCFQSVHTDMFSLRKSGRAKPTCYSHVALVCTTSKYLVVSLFCVVLLRAVQ